MVVPETFSDVRTQKPVSPVLGLHPCLISSERSDISCVIHELDDGVGGMGGGTVMSVERVEEVEDGAQHPVLGGAIAECKCGGEMRVQSNGLGTVVGWESPKSLSLGSGLPGMTC